MPDEFRVLLRGVAASDTLFASPRGADERFVESPSMAVEPRTSERGKESSYSNTHPEGTRALLPGLSNLRFFLGAVMLLGASSSPSIQLQTGSFSFWSGTKSRSRQAREHPGTTAAACESINKKSHRQLQERLNNGTLGILVNVAVDGEAQNRRKE